MATRGSKAQGLEFPARRALLQNTNRRPIGIEVWRRNSRIGSFLAQDLSANHDNRHKHDASQTSESVKSPLHIPSIFLILFFLRPTFQSGEAKRRTVLKSASLLYHTRKRTQGYCEKICFARQHRAHQSSGFPRQELRPIAPKLIPS